jgi:hypothetical protein
MATNVEAYREKGEGVRVLFAFGVSQTFFELERDQIGPVIEALKRTFSDLHERFGVQVLGTLDDDETMVGPSVTWPWTCYILADAPDAGAAAAVCNLLRETSVGPDRLWKYIKVEARVGRPLFFGEPEQ